MHSAINHLIMLQEKVIEIVCRIIIKRFEFNEHLGINFPKGHQSVFHPGVYFIKQTK